ncbi:RNA polymerase subunit sigma-70 [Clostridium neonatale]|uniref:sigma-70 family RNA polymerase sigma factor n=1 Tax=Clostridium neonatale TaxID=137838 RepID=UPI00291C342A|nr:sigma-70 family RNA polymerase sigma factor [Clostridium neonatale]CAI3605732.1 RNA polymerase subunit sigma-70 [Clostridium neonatale]
MSNEELVKSYQEGNKEVLDELINNNMGIVRFIAAKYNNLNPILELDDLIQTGYIGLIKAVDKYRFDIDNPTNFITFAYILIKQEILACVNGKDSREKGNNNLCKSCKSLNSTLKDDEETELIETLDSHDTSIENLEDKLYLERLRNELEKAMEDNISLREREVLKLHYGWDMEPITFSEINKIFNVSKDRSRQIESNAIRKIKNSVWGRTSGIQYRNEIMNAYSIYDYKSAERRIDDEISELYRKLAM